MYLFIYLFCSAPFIIKAHSVALNAASFAHRFSNCPHTTKKKTVCPQQEEIMLPVVVVVVTPTPQPQPLVTADVMPASLRAQAESQPKVSAHRPPLRGG